mmetsp:Transcript_20808/g.67418  ORF Transcript_20808/g.67418 Transcript_20808/m.67418 type:complete len:219 (-) Transcript_20808:389-1045(-)|eukprot:scaffold29955_cov129-Isochrysis_galbana.AAC.1
MEREVSRASSGALLIAAARAIAPPSPIPFHERSRARRVRFSRMTAAMARPSVIWFQLRSTDSIVLLFSRAAQIARPLPAISFRAREMRRREDPRHGPALPLTAMKPRPGSAPKAGASLAAPLSAMPLASNRMVVSFGPGCLSAEHSKKVARASVPSAPAWFCDRSRCCTRCGPPVRIARKTAAIPSPPRRFSERSRTQMSALTESDFASGPTPRGPRP